jgi:hypothetical protein
MDVKRKEKRRKKRKKTLIPELPTATLCHLCAVCDPFSLSLTRMRCASENHNIAPASFHPPLSEARVDAPLWNITTLWYPALPMVFAVYFSKTREVQPSWVFASQLLRPGLIG